MCILVIRNFAMVKNKFCVIKNVDGIDEILLDVNTIPS
jgi:hypothetical protein